MASKVDIRVGLRSPVLAAPDAFMENTSGPLPASETGAVVTVFSRKINSSMAERKKPGGDLSEKRKRPGRDRVLRHKPWACCYREVISVGRKSRHRKALATGGAATKKAQKLGLWCFGGASQNSWSLLTVLRGLIKKKRGRKILYTTINSKIIFNTLLIPILKSDFWVKFESVVLCM